MENDSKYVRCKRCNRPLKRDEAQILGYGVKCYQKMLQENKKPQFNLFSLTDTKK